MTRKTLLPILATLLIMAGHSYADVINVPADYPTIQGAIDASSDGDVINIAAGTYNEHSLNPGGKAITIQGSVDSKGHPETIIDAQHNGAVVLVISNEGPDTIIQDLVLIHGIGPYYSSVRGGGGICCSYSSPSIRNCVIRNNSCDVTQGGGGGLVFYNSNATVFDCVIQDNSAIGGYGGGISLDDQATITFTNCTIKGNLATHGGGIASAYPSTAGAKLIDCLIEENQSDFGGGILCHSGSSMAIQDCLIQNNNASQGGGLFARYSSPPITNSIFVGNTATDNGGAIRMSGSSSLIQYCEFRSNSGPSGGAIHAWDVGSPIIESSSFIGNMATENYGGACGFATSVNAAIRSSVFRNNSAAATGGAVASFSGTFSLEDSLFCANTPDDVTTFTDLGGNTFLENCAGNCCTGNDLFCISVTEPEHCLDFGGVFLDQNSSCEDCVITCHHDVDQDGDTDIEDLLIVISGWGSTCP